ncbi:hypothetical protein CMO83_02440 [Candidatus Woesearchaeota archaeon]|nr:hypothetical protein [Candidatus Woesearchaeota archaeon]MDP6648282.1 hypothetical protein [Candidatus Woesearchaeota archaeon]
MGFLKFLKREKKTDNLEELDLPPEPPALEGFDEGSDLEFPDLGEQKLPSSDKVPADIPEEDGLPELEEDMPNFPTIPDVEENPMPPIPPISAPPQTPEAEISPPIIESEKEDLVQTPVEPQIQAKPVKKLFDHEKKAPEVRPGKHKVYVRVDRYKNTLDSISLVRGDLRNSEKMLIKMDNIKNAKDRSFEKAKSSLTDLQKKLIFIDKTLFKGE